MSQEIHNAEQFFRELDERPENHIASVTVSALAGAGIGKRVYGQINIETNDPDGLNVLFCTYPSGDFYAWFVQMGFYIMIALVDEKLKCLGIVNVTDTDRWRRILNDTANGLNIKHHYPVQYPEEFLQGKADENKPDQSEG